MSLMPESDWFGGALIFAIVLALGRQLYVAFVSYAGRRRACAVGGALAFFVLGLPLIFLAGFVMSLVLGTFVFPPR